MIFFIGNISKPFLLHLHRVYFSSGWTLLYPLLFFSNYDLLILPISGLQGFNFRHVSLFLKFSLWSVRILKDSLSLSALVLMRSAKSSEHVWKLKKKQQQKISTSTSNERSSKK